MLSSPIFDDSVGCALEGKIYYLIEMFDEFYCNVHLDTREVHQIIAHQLELPEGEIFSESEGDTVDCDGCVDSRHERLEGRTRYSDWRE